jgi:hypothetical protein
LAIAARVEAVAAALAGSDGDRARAAERGECPFGLEAIDVLSNGDQELAGVAGRDTQQRSDLDLDTLRNALTRRLAGADVQLIHHSDAGSQPELKGSSQRRLSVTKTVAATSVGSWR